VADTLVGEHAGYKNKPYSIAGGGNTVAMLNRFGLAGRFDFLSTGGGACLKMLAGEKLAGIEALTNKDSF
jgi:phosphoglycerate kinase